MPIPEVVKPKIGSKIEKLPPQEPPEPEYVSSEEEDYSKDDEDTMRSKKAMRFSRYLENSGI